MKHLINKKIIAIASLLFLASGCSRITPQENYTQELHIGPKKIFVEIAKAAEQKRQGLSGRGKLKDNQGMLFDFTGTGEVRSGFWMKDMKFDLDLIWIKGGKIVGIIPNVPHPESIDDKLPLYYPPSEVDYVLEVNAGWSEKYKIKIEDEIKLKN